MECVADGDTIVPGMTFALPVGIGTTQYFNPSSNEVSPDYTKLETKILVYPTCYSSGKGVFIEPDAGSWQWYINSPESEDNALLATKGVTSGVTKDARFEASSYTISGKTFPALKIVGNLASEDNPNDVVLYCKFTYGGMSITCHATIAVKETTGSLYEVVISCMNNNNQSDTVIDNATEYLVLSAFLQRNGVAVAVTNTWKWLHATTTGNVEVVHKADQTEISGEKNYMLKLYDAGVEGNEEYFAEIDYNGVTYRKGIQVADVHDPYYIELGRDVTSTLIKETQDVTYSPTVYNRSTGKVETKYAWSYAFAATDNDGNTVSQQAAGKGTTFTVHGSDVKKYGSLTVRITATAATSSAS